MSTRKKEVAPPGKEKRGTSPSNAGSGRRSPGPPKTNDSNPSGKSIPSYLKPTVSSSSAVADASKIQLAKKKASPTIDKPAIERRRSFDRPPSPSRSTKSPASPTPTFRSSSFSVKSNNDPGVARRRSFDKPPSPSRTAKSPASPNPMRRSSSTGRTSATLSKGVLERNLKGAKDAGKQSTLYARPTASSVKKTSSVTTKKSEAGNGSLRKKRVESSPEKVDSPNVSEPELEPEPQADDQECFVGAEEEPEYSLLEEEDVTSIIEQIEGESHDNDAVLESPTVTEQHDATIESPSANENQEDKTETVEPSTGLEHKDEDEVEEKSRDEEISNQQEDIKEETDQTDNHDESGAGDPNEEKERDEEISNQQEDIKDETDQTDNHDESGAGDPNEEKEREEDNQNEEAIEVDNDSKSNEQLEEKEEQEVVVEEKKEEEEQEVIIEEKKEEEEQEVVLEEKKEEEEQEEDATPRVAHGKKDLTLSNDVIEETRNKLTEQRRNKVKALAGAFESVISSQDK